MKFLIRRMRRKTALKLKDSDDVPQTSTMLMTGEVADGDCQKTIADDWANFTEPAMKVVTKVPKSFSTDATGKVLQDLERFHKVEMHSPRRPPSASNAKKTSGYEPVWRRRFRVLKASIDQETHPFDEGDNPLQSVYRVRKNSEGEEETPETVYSAPFTQSEELDRSLLIKRARSDHYAGSDKKYFRHRLGETRTHSMRRDESLYSDPFKNIDDPDGFSLETPSSVGIHSFENSYSTTSATDLEDGSNASSYSSGFSSHKRSKSGFGVGKFLDAIGGIRVTETSTFADEVKNFADLVVDQAACSRCAPDPRVH